MKNVLQLLLQLLLSLSAQTVFLESLLEVLENNKA